MNARSKSTVNSLQRRQTRWSTRHIRFYGVMTDDVTSWLAPWWWTSPGVLPHPNLNHIKAYCLTVYGVWLKPARTAGMVPMLTAVFFAVCS